MQKKLQFYSYTLPNSACLASSKFYIMYTGAWAVFARTAAFLFTLPDMARNLPDGTDTGGRGDGDERKQKLTASDRALLRFALRISPM